MKQSALDENIQIVNLMNILCYAAHPDDVEFLCAGTLALYASEGHKIFIAIATNGNVGSPTLSKTEISKVRKKESLDSCKKIGAQLKKFGYIEETDTISND